MDVQDEEVEMTPGPDDPQPLSEEEEKEKASLLEGGFKDWTRRDFSAFVRACEKVISLIYKPKVQNRQICQNCTTSLVIESSFSYYKCFNIRVFRTEHSFTVSSLI